jgi:hypothetical protein
MQMPAMHDCGAGHPLSLVQPPGFWQTMLMHWVPWGQSQSPEQYQGATHRWAMQVKLSAQSALDWQTMGWQ